MNIKETIIIQIIEVEEVAVVINIQIVMNLADHDVEAVHSITKMQNGEKMKMIQKTQRNIWKKKNLISHCLEN